jgi:AcrR family transcriptional regulator
MHERLNRQERKSRTREQLLDAAAAVFARRGFEAATLDEVAAAAGYTKGAVYSNFASKTDLLIGLIERRIEVASAYQERRLAGASQDDAAGGLDVGAAQPGLDQQWLVLAVEFWLHAMRDPQARVLMAGQYERARTVAAQLIAGAYDKAGRRPPLSPRDLAIVVEALGTGLALQAALDPERVSMGLQAEVLGRVLGMPLPGNTGPEKGGTPAGG